MVASACTQRRLMENENSNNPVDLDEFQGAPFWVGLDMASSQDLTSFAWRTDDGFSCFDSVSGKSASV